MFVYMVPQKAHFWDSQNVLQAIFQRMESASTRLVPGFIDTPMFHQAVDQDLPRQQKILGHTPQCCYGKPEDIGWAATYLSSEAAGFVNGSTLVVDGGFSIGF